MYLKRRFFPVVDAQTGEGGSLHALSSIQTCVDGGADGVFLIPDYERGDAKASARDLIEHYINGKKAFPNFRIGLNLFGMSELEITSFLNRQKPDMIQIDSISSSSGIIVPEHTEVFCGLDEDISGSILKKHCFEVSEMCGVSTTRGPARGDPDNWKRIEVIKGHLGKGIRVAVASGVRIDSVAGFIDIEVSDFLVGTSLIHSFKSETYGFNILNSREVAVMAEIIHG
jgi:hypothetical protein